MLTIKEARKVLGKKSDEMTEEELIREIESANLLKELFFKQFIINKNHLTSKLVS